MSVARDLSNLLDRLLSRAEHGKPWVSVRVEDLADAASMAESIADRETPDSTPLPIDSETIQPNV
jgi:hypothetical protein